ncbi:MAG: hypothetical protein ABR606_02805 [Vicinamibacterales bacterium]
MAAPFPAAAAHHGGVPVMHEYPRNPTFDSVSKSRVNVLAGFGFTQRQREFLVTVMVHAGCFLERQYCAYTGTARGQNSREFVGRWVARGFARAIEPGPVRRGRLCPVHHKPLYEAIGLPDDRNRRLQSMGRMVKRVMILDAVLSDRRCWWLDEAFLFAQTIDSKSYERKREQAARGTDVRADRPTTSKRSTNSTYRASWRSQNASCRARQTCGCRRRSTTSSGCSSCSSLRESRSTEIDLIEPR